MKRSQAPASEPTLQDTLTVWTIGHSTRPAEDFLALLRAHAIEQLIDVRTIPRSLHNPQYAQERLSPFLENTAIHYQHMPSLGGLRRPRPDSVNTAWRNASFRGYADYMQTEEFAAALDELIAAARMQRTAIMCAEAVPWRCHRSLIADALLAREIGVEEIASLSRARPYSLRPWARVHGTRVSYPQLDVDGTPPETNP